MPNDIFNFFVAVFLRGRGILTELLRKAEAHAAERKIAPTVLFTARLFPDMSPLTGQVQGACDTAKRATWETTGVRRLMQNISIGQANAGVVLNENSHGFDRPKDFDR
jgi:uncharacterized protein